MEEIVKIVHANLETPLILSSEHVLLLIVENPNAFFNYVSFFHRQLEGENGELIFTRAGKEVDPQKEGSIVCDFFHFSLNERRSISMLHKELAAAALCGEGSMVLQELNGKLTELFSGLFLDFPFPISHEELTMESILKSSAVQFEEIYDTLLEKIVGFINVQIALKRCTFFVFVNLKSVLDDASLQELYRHCSMEKVGILLLESSKIRPLLPQEGAVIITEDLCEIVEKLKEM